MTKARKIVTSSISIVLVLLTLTALCLPTFAATKSNGIKTTTITVTTKSNWWIPGSESITLTQSKGTTSVKNIFTKKDKVYNVYGCWNVVASATDGSHTLRTNFDGKSIKLNLKPNKTYKITISWDKQSSELRTICDGKGNFKSYPTWKVSKTCKVSSYY